MSKVRPVWSAVVALFVLRMASAESSTAFLNESFGAGWTVSTTPGGFLTLGNFIPIANFDAVETPQNVLRVQNDATARFSGIEYQLPQPSAYGIDVYFTQSQWGGTGADGM